MDQCQLDKLNSARMVQLWPILYPKREATLQQLELTNKIIIISPFIYKTSKVPSLFWKEFDRQDIKCKIAITRLAPKQQRIILHRNAVLFFVIICA